MEIRQEIKRRAADIEARIAPFLPQEKGFQQTVLDAMEYSVFAGGKRLRPMLMEASYQMFDGTNPAIDDFMAAIEMIHTYSLIHDDLPAMDNDEYRRGSTDQKRRRLENCQGFFRAGTKSGYIRNDRRPGGGCGE